MNGGLLDFSARGWGRVLGWTALGALGCVAVALYVDSFNWPGLDGTARTRAMLTDLIVPTILAVPMLLFLLIKLRELAIAHEDLARLASIDSLTAVLNRGAFTAMVDGYLLRLQAEAANTRGALLLVDADNFKSINDSFGHDRGDEALKLIAVSIQGILRSTDFVGRIGGEEFAVFLPGASTIQAEIVAERIRRAVTESGFLVDGAPRDLSVSVGGAVFERRLAFGDLFRLADQQLYAAKREGRNRVSVAPVMHYEGIPSAA
jgi:diguanylate cyclase (GGDEF)-like protein